MGIWMDKMLENLDELDDVMNVLAPIIQFSPIVVSPPNIEALE